MNVTRYQIKCLKCGGTSRAEVDGLDRIFWSDVKEVISGRKRLDQQWGWQCSCGNNDIMTAQEKRMIADPVQPTPMEIDTIIKNIVPDKPKFSMEKV